jgi:hypothetical protein
MIRRLFLMLCLVAAVCASAQTVVTRGRIGNTTEASTYVSTGRLAGSLLIVDGYDALVFPASNPRVPGRIVFDTKGFMAVRPNGVGFIPAEQLFVFVSGVTPSVLYFADDHGRGQGTLPIQYMGGWTPTHLEGIVYIPPGAPRYADHFVLAATIAGTADVRLEIINRSGVVVSELAYDASTLPAEDSFGGVEYLPAGTLLVGLDNYVLEIDLDGNILAYHDLGTGWFEGVTRTPAGEIFVVGRDFGQATFFDAAFNRLPALDRNFLFVPGIQDIMDIAWNSRTGEYLVFSRYPPNAYRDVEPGVWVYDRLMRSGRKIIDLTAGWNQYRQMVYLPGEDRVALLWRHQPGPGMPAHPDIRIFSLSGALIETLSLDLPGLGCPNRNLIPSQLGYNPETNEFILRRITPACGMLPEAQIVSRQGLPVRVLDLSATGFPGYGSVTWFGSARPYRGDLLFVYGNQAFITDYQGNLLQTFDASSALHVINVSSPTYLGSTPLGPQFATWDQTELITFRLNGPGPK